MFVSWGLLLLLLFCLLPLKTKFHVVDTVVFLRSQLRCSSDAESVVSRKHPNVGSFKFCLAAGNHMVQRLLLFGVACVW